MGGDSFFPMNTSSASEEESLLGQDFPHESAISRASSRDEERLCCNWKNYSVINRESGSSSGEIPVDSCRIASSISEAAERQKVKVFADVFRSYEEFQSRADRLEEAKSRILSYCPGSWAEKAGGIDLNKYSLPHITSLLLVGPKSSGKSNLINKISRLLEDNVFATERAQVSYNSSTGGGTYFLHEYKVPRGSGSFCLYDSRGLAIDSSENTKMLFRWMTKGVCHGELVKRKSDNADLKALLKCKDLRSCSSSQFRTVNFVIFVVNGLSVLESMDNGDKEKQQYTQIIASNFNNPLLSFKDDKPVLVVTHGDLLSLSDRVRIRVYLAELLGIPPTGQIFDIPEDDDAATKLAISEMLIYCLERADRNLPPKDLSVLKVPNIAYWLFLIVTWLAIMYLILHLPHSKKARTRVTPPPPIVFEWHKIRHLWLE